MLRSHTAWEYGERGGPGGWHGFADVVKCFIQNLIIYAKSPECVEYF